MKRKVITMIGIAAVFGAASIFVADLWLRSQAVAQVEVATPASAAPEVAFGTIVVAKEPLRYGMAVSAGTLDQIPWPRQSLPAGAFATVDALLAEGARVVLSPIEPNEPVLLAKLSGPNGRATLSNLLSPGMRAVTIRTDEIAGVGGFIAPGDRVDVVLTRDAGSVREVQGIADGAAGSTITSEIVVANVKVMRVGQGTDDGATAPQVAGSVTLEVDTNGAQKVALARNIGSLSLTLRSAGEAGLSPDGLTTLSSFGGSVAEHEVGGGLGEKVGALLGTAKAAPEPVYKTVIIRRGTEEGQSYQVVAPQR